MDERAPDERARHQERRVTITASHTKKRISNPDEIREFPNGSGSMKVLELGEETLGYATFNPGWQWSKNMKAKAGTDSCQVMHNMYVLSGRLHIRMEDGTEFEVGPGDAVFVAPGHDAWTLGNEPCVVLDWTGARTYAK
jgi:mannose-6-phosphate isomerase-like protein (cupin superfamily)